MSCGTGSRSHTRSCIPPRNGGQNCTGNATVIEQCTTVCGVDGTLSQWSEWGGCSSTCGGGAQTRNRVCTPPQGGGRPCTGALQESKECGTAFCPVNGSWEEWTEWGSCSVPLSGQCGTQSGVRRRERTCIPPQHGGLTCQGDNAQISSCGPPACEPVDSTVSQWQQWGSCTRTCGTGQRVRNRQCLSLGLYGGITCMDRGLEETEDCNTLPCPVDAVVSDWSSWSGCSMTCGDGTQTRTRTCVSEQQNGGQSCASMGLQEELACNEALCVIDATLSDWDSWTVCTVSCGGGTQSRSRHCLTQPQNGGKTCAQLGELSESRNCGGDTCPVDGVLSEWTQWSDCDVACGDGQRERSRECSPAEHGGVSCESEVLSQSETCFVAPGCPVDGVLSDWTDWTPCTLSCGGGEQSRDRTCTPPENGGLDCGQSSLSQTVSCNADPCPVDG